MNLNHQQNDAVIHYGTPQVIIAGAGTGKTTVMIEKIKHLISNQKHAGKNILALTFTNKAANEMKERFQTFATPGDTPFFGTFHSFCLQFLKSTPHLESIGIDRNFTIIDHQQQKETIQKLIKSHNITIDRKPVETLSKISSIKQFPQHDHAERISDAAEDIQQLFTPYNTHLKQLNCVDFDDLLLHTYSILAMHPDALNHLQSKYEYLIIDEYQDTNKIQNDLCILLAKSHQNICVVGDFDQTIYSWRGAKVENLLEFNQYFPAATTYKLEINYRSTTEILSAANQLITHNTQRFPKKLSTDRSSGNSIQHIICFDERQEATYIAEKINDLTKTDEYKLNDFAILYRTNQQSRAIEETLIHYNLPHHIVGTTPFYQRREVKNCIAYLQCLDNINQPIWFERAILNPARGTGKKSLDTLLQFSLDQNLTISDAIQHPNCPLKERYLIPIQEFINLIESLNQNTQLTIREKLDAILDELKFDEHLKAQENYADRMDNIKELMSKLDDVSDLNSFLNEVTLFQSTDSSDNDGKISCLTLHLAKGLEFPVVFIPGFENDLLPLRNTDSLEEERRLAYVGITRGKDQVYLLSTYKRTLMGDDWYHNISQFTKELEGTITISITEQAYLIGKAIVFKLNDANLDFNIIESKKEKKPIVSATKQTFEIFNVGDVVFHKTLGTGTVESTSGNDDGLMYQINFSSGKKTLMAKFAPLEAVT